VKPREQLPAEFSMRKGYLGITAAAMAMTGFAFDPTVVNAATTEATTMQSSYAQVSAHLRKASIPVAELGSDAKVAVTLAAGRVVAMRFSNEGKNLLWSNPLLSDTQLVKMHPEKLIGGYGGDRLWLSPELIYSWDGKPDWKAFANYKTPAAMDPGAYEIVKKDSQSITLHATGELVVHGADRRVGFDVLRTIRMAESPLPKSNPLMQGVDYVGIETSHVLKVAAGTRVGTIDLWHLMQVPAGAVLIVPIKKTASPVQMRPLSYAAPGGWTEEPGHILWRFGGTAHAKFGLSSAALTGRSAVLRELEPGRWCMIVRQYPVDPKGKYGDHPYGEPRSDQAFQAWDGFGFGEVEFHSTVLDAELGPRELKESDQLWAFGGSAQAISALAFRLLAVDVGSVMKP
jgi:hypothetical protein